MRRYWRGIAVTAVVAATTAAGEGLRAEAAEGRVHAFSPRSVEPTPQRVAGLKLAEGFSISVFAEGLEKARMMAVDEGGVVYLTEPQPGRVLTLEDRDGDGRAERVQTLFPDMPMVHGIMMLGQRMYLADVRRVWVVERGADGRWGDPRAIIDDLPSGGRHPLRTLGIGPDDGQLYISVGSTCNACEESDPEHATMLRAALDGSQRSVFARGLRNTIGFDWHPQTRELWGMDHGSDDRGDDLPPEELNHLKEGGDYGWPWVFGNRQLDPLMPWPQSNGTSHEEYARTTEAAALTYQAHSAPIAFIFYRGEQFPKRYRGGAFVAFHGSWNRYPATGYKVAFVRFENGRPMAFEDFVTGFLAEDGRAQFGRPAGLAVARDGALLVSDDDHGVIYRVSYEAPVGEPVTQPSN